MSMQNYDTLRAYIPDFFKRSDFVLMGSAALAARGVRDVNDLDMLIRPHLWGPVHRLRNEKHWPTKPIPEEVLRADKREALAAAIEHEEKGGRPKDAEYAGRELVRTGWMDFSSALPRIARCVEVDEVFDKADVFDGYRVICLRHCLAIKVLANRKKDLRDMVQLATLINQEEGP